MEKQKLFHTSAEHLWETFLENIDSTYRQHYNCRCCEKFIENYGGIVYITENGESKSAIWDLESTPELFKDAVKKVLRIIKRSHVTSEFIATSDIMGTPISPNGIWNHFHIDTKGLYPRTYNEYQKVTIMSESITNYRLLKDTMTRYSVDVLRKAYTFADTKTIDRSEKFIDHLEFLLGLKEKIEATKNELVKDNMIWFASVSTLPSYCHVSASVIGTLLDDLEDGISDDYAIEDFNEKVAPDKYMRNQSGPSDGQINEANKLIKELGLESALARRFARVDEIEAIWRPCVEDAASESNEESMNVFDHLKSKKETTKDKIINIPGERIMTFVKFLEDIIPVAKEMSIVVPYTSFNFSAILTQNDPDAGRIIRWDKEDHRNPFSYYCYKQQTYSINWGLQPLSRVNVTAISYQPPMWTDYTGLGRGVFFILDGCKDNFKSSGAVGTSLFPEILIPELYPIRKTIEAFSNNDMLHGAEEASACGFRLQDNLNWNQHVQVITKDNRRINVIIDRWE